MREQPDLKGGNISEDEAGENTESASATVEQKRAAFLLDRVQSRWLDENGNLRPETRKVAQEYRRLVQRLPAMIMNNGLPQALAFLLSKRNSVAAQVVVTDLTDGLVDLRGLYAVPSERAQSLLIARIIDGTREQLRQATEEAMALLAWWVRFVRAFIESDATDDPTTS